jgi:glycosyltransferase involved in cell wall biosynthesis
LADVKILHVNISDSIGGASKAAYRLHKSLIKIGVDSHMLVFNKDTDDNTVISLKNKKQKIFLEIRRYIENKILNRYSHRVRIIFSLSLLRNRHLIKKINNINPDIVHLHWVNGGLLGIIDLLKIKRKIVWSMHDNWIISGGCHIKWDCEKYKTICSECPILKSKKKHDLSKLIFILKRSVYNKINNITFIALSSWLYNCSKKSLLLKEKNIIHLPNPINTKFFKKIDKKNARKICNLELKCKIILFGAMNATSDRNKGFNILYKA